MLSARGGIRRLRRLQLMAARFAAGFIFSMGFLGAQAQPPFSGTLFIDPDVVRSDDPSAFESIVPAGRGDRTLFDRRLDEFVTLNVFLFKATYGDGRIIEVQVNPEFGSEQAALAVASPLAAAVGQLPAVLRRDVAKLWIHDGVQPFGGGNRSLLIHTGQAALYAADGFLEEALIHEAAHTSLDSRVGNTFGWSVAVTLDAEFISDYARSNPDREDIAESFLPYLAARFRAGRLSPDTVASITTTIPNRIYYFDSLAPDLFPMPFPILIPIVRFDSDRQTGALELEWVARIGFRYAVQRSTDLKHWSTEQEVTATQATTTSKVHVVQSGAVFYRMREL